MILPSVSDLTLDQRQATDRVVDWIESSSPAPVLTLAGLAGTGKTTVSAMAISTVKKRRAIAYVSFTGKATNVFRQKLYAAGTPGPEDFIGTIHSLIYKAIVDPITGRILGFELRRSLSVDLIVVDEASMISSEIWEDLQSFGIPILAVGDHGQLPPVGGRLNLMENPDIKLETIHRQAKDDPIVKLSMMARKDGRIPFGKYSEGVWKMRATPQYVVEKFPNPQDAMIMCGFNYTRIELNDLIRRHVHGRNYSTTPIPSDKVICLRNNHRVRIYNGQIGVLSKVTPFKKHWYDVSVSMEGREDDLELRVSRHQFNKPKAQFEVKGLQPNQIGQLFDFGYAITVHKSQGSEADRCIVFEQRNQHQSDDDWRRWLYTAITRAKKELYIIAR